MEEGVGEWAEGQDFSDNPVVDDAIGNVLKGGAALIAGAATKSLVNGTDFGDNLLNGLPNVIGETIGNAIGDQVQDQRLLDYMSKLPGADQQSNDTLRSGAGLLSQADAIGGRTAGTTYNMVLNNADNATTLWDAANLDVDSASYSDAEKAQIATAYLALAGVSVGSNSGSVEAITADEAKHGWLSDKPLKPGDEPGKINSTLVTPVTLSDVLQGVVAQPFATTQQAALTLGYVARLVNPGVEWFANFVQDTNSGAVFVDSLVQSNSPNNLTPTPTEPIALMSKMFGEDEFAWVGDWHLHPEGLKPNYGGAAFSEADYRNTYAMEHNSATIGAGFQSFVTVAADGYNNWATYALPTNLPDFDTALRPNTILISPTFNALGNFRAPDKNLADLTIQGASGLQAYGFLYYDSTGYSITRYVVPGIPVVGNPLIPGGQ